MYLYFRNGIINPYPLHTETYGYRSFCNIYCKQYGICFGSQICSLLGHQLAKQDGDLPQQLFKEDCVLPDEQYEELAPQLVSQDEYLPLKLVKQESLSPNIVKQDLPVQIPSSHSRQILNLGDKKRPLGSFPGLAVRLTG